MIRILSNTRFVLFHSKAIANLLHHVDQAIRMKADARRLELMPRDRLEDMGIAPRTKVNYRSSGEPGQVERPPLW